MNDTHGTINQHRDADTSHPLGAVALPPPADREAQSPADHQSKRPGLPHELGLGTESPGANDGTKMESPDRPPVAAESAAEVRESGVSTTSPVVSNAPLTFQLPTRPLREADLIVGARRLAIAHDLLRMVQTEGLSQRAAARRAGVSDKEACQWLQIIRRNPSSSAELFAPRRVNSGMRPRVWLEDEEVKASLAALIATNRTETAGSTTEALRIAGARGHLRSEIVSLIEQRTASGQTPLPPAAMAQLRLSETVVRGHRAPRNAWLDYVCSPGSLQVTIDAETGEERLVQPGERWTIDDGSINLLCVVPGLERPGDPCWNRWRVAVGRFQLLVIVDHRTRFIVGWSFTARPRDSYRAEDIVATFHPAVMEHGAPREMVLEHGVSAAGLISQTLHALGVQIIRASSPHQKVVESVFNSLWTRLSPLPGQVGRFRGEEEACNRMLQRIRSGALDPRGLLLDLPALLSALRDAIALHNSAVVNSERCGRWTPSELWTQESTRWLRRVPASDAWMFAPHCSAPIKVRGGRIETSWQPMPGWTVKLVFAADWLLEFHGVRVVVRYNAHAPECEAMAILAEDCGTRRRGEVLGALVQIDRMARMTRRALGYGIDPDIGLSETRAAAQALRRHVAAVRPDGKPGIQSHEIRSGNGDAVRVDTGSAAGHALENNPQSPRERMHDVKPTGEPKPRRGLGRSNDGVQVNRSGAATPDLNSAAMDPRFADFEEHYDFPAPA